MKQASETGRRHHYQLKWRHDPGATPQALLSISHGLRLCSKYPHKYNLNYLCIEEVSLHKFELLYENAWPQYHEAILEIDFLSFFFSLQRFALILKTLSISLRSNLMLNHSIF